MHVMWIIMKICTSCKEEKDFSEFSKHRLGKNGLNSQCKSCSNVRAKKWRLENKDKVSAINKQYYEANKEQIQTNNRAWHEQNREYSRECSRRYSRENKEQIHLQRQSKKEERSLYDRQRYLDNRQYYLDKADKRRALKQGAKIGVIPYNALQQLAELQDYLCGICGEYLEGELVGSYFHKDHIIPLTRGGLHSMSNLQATHASCNLSKGNKLPEEMEDEGNNG